MSTVNPLIKHNAVAPGNSVPIAGRFIRRGESASVSGDATESIPFEIQGSNWDAIQAFIAQTPEAIPLLADFHSILHKSFGRPLHATLALHTAPGSDWQQLVITVNSGHEHPDQRTHWEKLLFEALAANEEWVAALEFVTITQGYERV